MDGGQAEAYEISGKIKETMTDAERAEGWRLIARWREIYGKSHPRK
jgi:hypothetical protein